MKVKEHSAHSGAWGIALIVIVVASWLLYRYLAPKTWKEWAGAGVLQAFTIAIVAIGGQTLGLYHRACKSSAAFVLEFLYHRRLFVGQHFGRGFCD